MIYRWANSAYGQAYGDSTELVEYIRQLKAQEDVSLDVLEREANRRASPLYHLVERDRDEGFRRYRRHQLANIMSRIVKVQGGQMSRVFIPVRDPRGDEPRYYEEASRALRMPELRKQYARRGLMEISRLQAKYGDFPEIRNILRVMNRALKPVLQPALAQIGED